MPSKKIATNDEQKYSDLLQQAVTEITVARTSLARQVNSTVMSAYWNIGKLLFAEKLEGGYGSGIINRLSVDLKTHFPDMGLSPRNLWDMKRFYERYYEGNEKLLRCVAVLPWRHNQLLPKQELQALIMQEMKEMAKMEE